MAYGTADKGGFTPRKNKGLLISLIFLLQLSVRIGVNRRFHAFFKFCCQWLLFGRRGMPGGGKKNLGDQALRVLKRKPALVKIKIAVATAD
jgi:hypothetical protein